MNENLYKRLAKAEAAADARKAELTETLEKAYSAACEANDEERAAELCREIRNRLLDKSDKQLSLDRLGLDTSSVIAFLSSLANVFNGAWARYRQQLRDLTRQEGFPLDVSFPEMPEDAETAES